MHHVGHVWYSVVDIVTFCDRWITWTFDIQEGLKSVKVLTFEGKKTNEEEGHRDYRWPSSSFVVFVAPDSGATVSRESRLPQSSLCKIHVTVYVRHLDVASSRYGTL